jgi:hypothetical protein
MILNHNFTPKLRHLKNYVESQNHFKTFLEQF